MQQVFFYLAWTATSLAEPARELQKAYDQFLYRVKLYKRRKAKTEERKLREVMQASHLHDSKTGATRSNHNGMEGNFKSLETGVHSMFNEPGHSNTEDCLHLFKGGSHLKHHLPSEDSRVELSCSSLRSVPRGPGAEGQLEIDGDGDLGTTKNFPGSDDTVVVKFVGSAIVGKSETEDACHHGLVDPTINMKEAMNAIGNMFREPLEIDTKGKRRPTQSDGGNLLKKGFQVFVDDSEDQVDVQIHRQLEGGQAKTFGEEFKILADDDEEEDETEGFIQHNYLNKKGPHLPDPLPETSGAQRPSCVYEDTVIRRFVGSMIHDEPEVENACHHGLVDPTINLKEAMDDINGMFGEPLHFVRPSRSRKRENLPAHDRGFSILADDDAEDQPVASSLPSSSRNPAGESGLFEPTICTKEALAEINAMFGMAMDF